MEHTLLLHKQEKEEEDNDDNDNDEDININDWSFESLDLIKNCQHYYNLNNLSKIKDILLQPLIKSYISTQTLLHFEDIFRNVLLFELNTDNDYDFEFIMTPGYCCGSKNCRKYLIDFAKSNINDNDKKYAKKYMNWPEIFEFWCKCMNDNDNDNNDNGQKIKIILTPQIGKLILNCKNVHEKQLLSNLQEKVNDFHCRLILLIIIPTNTKTTTTTNGSNNDNSLQQQLNHFECIYSIYDCNGTEIDLYKLITNEYEISAQDLIKYPFLYHLKHNRISLNGIGYYMNQWIKFYIDKYNEKSIGSCYFFVLWSSISVLIAWIFNKKELMTICQQIMKKSKGISFKFQSNEINYMKMNIIRLLNYDIQRLIISKLIIDARSYLTYKVTPSQFNVINNDNRINKEARTKQTARRHNGGATGPRKQTSLYRPRIDNNNKNKYKYKYKYKCHKMTSTIHYMKLSKAYYYKSLKMTSSKQYRYKSFCSKLL